MKHRTKQFCSILLAFLLVIGMMPAMVFAADGEIDEVSFSFTEPEAGENIAEYIEACVPVVDESAHYMVECVDWILQTREEEDGSISYVAPDSEVFENKIVYIVSFTLKPEDGYIFTPDYEDGGFYNAEINGRWNWDGEILDDGSLRLEHRFAVGLIKIEELVYTFPEPVIGKTAGSMGPGTITSVPEGALTGTFDCVWFESDDDTFGKIASYEDFESQRMSENDTFQQGKYYGVRRENFEENIADGYWLDMYTLVINGGEWFDHEYIDVYFGPLVPTVETPEFTPDETTFRGSIDVTISCLTEGAEIHYTIDGSDPTVDSEITTGAAITLDRTTTLKAIAILEGYNDSEVAEATYTLIRPSGGATPPADPEPEPENDPADKPAEDPAPSGDNTFPFTDVPEDAYCRDAVEWAVDNGITGGTTETTFSPKAPATRAQVMTFIWVACGSPEPAAEENPFMDVSKSVYYYKAVLWAYEQGITAGISADMFGSDQTVTRGQIATFLYGVAGRPAAGSEPFTDVESSDYFADPVAWAYQMGITSGTGATTFSPDADCLREQIITFLYLYFAK